MLSPGRSFLPALDHRLAYTSTMLKSLLLIVALGAVQVHDGPRAEIQSLYDRAAAATIAQRSISDAEALRGWLDTTDCVYKNAGQPWRTWAEMRPFVEAELQTPLRSLSLRIQTLEESGAQAAAVTVVRGTATIVDRQGQFGPRGEARVITTTATVRDIWTKTASGWRRKSHEKIVPNQIVEVDGRPYGR